MYYIEADLHTHTLASDHAYSTLMELITEAANKGLKGIAITDHGPALPDAPCMMHFNNLKSIPRMVNGVLTLRGVEANLIDFEGNLDIPQNLLSLLDWVIVSIHADCFEAGTVEEHTRAWLGVVRNPLVDVIGHPGNGDYMFDYEQVIIEAKKYNKLIEINNHSFIHGVRMGSVANCPEIARLCKKHQVSVVVNSDAHFATQVGTFDSAFALLEKVDFPPELILNSSITKLVDFINQKRNQKIIL